MSSAVSAGCIPAPFTLEFLVLITWTQASRTWSLVREWVAHISVTNTFYRYHPQAEELLILCMSKAFARPKVNWIPDKSSRLLEHKAGMGRKYLQETNTKILLPVGQAQNTSWARNIACPFPTQIPATAQDSRICRPCVSSFLGFLWLCYHLCSEA